MRAFSFCPLLYFQPYFQPGGKNRDKSVCDAPLFSRPVLPVVGSAGGNIHHFTVAVVTITAAALAAFPWPLSPGRLLAGCLAADRSTFSRPCFYS
jgi:hypothetical protein